MKPIIELRAKIDGGPEQTFVGRFAWTLAELVKAGEAGCTPMDHPAPRWSHYVYRLRRDGVSIETVHEPHAGAFSGTHARYILRGEAQLLWALRAGEKRDAA